MLPISSDVELGTYVLSLDIDGTLEAGDPPGPISFKAVLRARSAGAIIGSCSDRTFTEQEIMWGDRGIVPTFVSGKQHLTGIRERFPTLSAYVHVGDTDVDRQWAWRADFAFVTTERLSATAIPTELTGWLALAETPPKHYTGEGQERLGARKK
jgi:hypothetical protein